MDKSSPKQVVRQFRNLVKVYSDGTVERLYGSPFVAPRPDGDPRTGVLSKDVMISENPAISARLYLPPHKDNEQESTSLSKVVKFPILVYFHGGAFCVESAFSANVHPYLNTIVSKSRVLAVSVEYRNAPESPLPAAYDDCWQALCWTVSTETEPWLAKHGDFDRLYIGGDSAGANIVHNVAMRSGAEPLPRGATILGAFLSHPYFWGSRAIGREKREKREETLGSMVWEFVYPGAPHGIDNPMVNPAGNGAESLLGIGCRKMLVCVAGKDELRDRGIWYAELMRGSGWGGELEIYEEEDGVHAFHALFPKTEIAKKMIQRLASFLK